MMFVMEMATHHHSLEDWLLGVRLSGVECRQIFTITRRKRTWSSLLCPKISSDLAVPEHLQTLG